MTDVWSKLRYFSRQELWGDPDKMDPDFLIQLDNFRNIIGAPFVLTTPAYAQSGHSANSYHYKGRAVDGRFVHAGSRESLSIIEHVMIALRAPFGGVGIYTWGAGGPFLHMDNRTATYDRKIWVSEKQGQYENLTPDFLRRSMAVSGRITG